MKEFPKHAQLTISADVLADIVEVSGYALIWTELVGGDAWKVVQATWDAYLAALPKPAEAIRFIMMMLDFRRATFVLAEVPIAAVKTHLQQCEPPPPLVDELIRRTFNAIVEAEVEKPYSQRR